MVNEKFAGLSHAGFPAALLFRGSAGLQSRIISHTQLYEFAYYRAVRYLICLRKTRLVNYRFVFSSTDLTSRSSVRYNNYTADDLFSARLYYFVNKIQN